MLVASYLFDATGGPGPCGSVNGAHEWMGARLGTAEFFTRRLRRMPLDADHPVWVPAGDLDLADHVHVHELGGGWPALRDSIARIAARRLDLGRPPWELHAITGATDIDGHTPVTATVLRVHHAAADRLDLRRLAPPVVPTAPPPAAPAAAARAHPPATAAQAVARLPSILLPSARTLRSTSPDVAAVAAPAADRPHTRFNDPASGRLAFDVTSFDLDQIRAARSVVDGATVNDVLLTIVGGALAARRAFQWRYPGSRSRWR